MIAALIFFGAGLAWALGLGQLTAPAGRGPTRDDYIRAGLFLCVGAWQTHGGLVHSGLIFSYPHLILLGTPFILLTGPLLYWTFAMLVDDGLEFSRRQLWHLAPGVFAFLALIPFLFLETAEKERMLRSSLRLTDAPYARAFFLCVSLYVLAYLGALLKRYSFLLRREYLREEKYAYTALLTALSLIASFMAFLAFALERIILLKLANATVSFITLMAYLISRRYPRLLANLVDEAERRRYLKSKLNNLDLEKLHEKLIALMREERLYVDEDLNLAGLAAALEITPHQLSQFLNQRLGKNFNAFLNEYRARAAAELLVDEPRRNALNIGLAVGFNSASAFHAAFRGVMGMTPGAYRKKNGQNGQKAPEL